MNCPCGSGNTFESCCAPYLSGEKQAPTPEALMRSRYSAYATNDLDYIEKTMKGEPLSNFNRAEIEAMQKETTWLKLVVLHSTEEGDEGTVSFIALYRYKDEEVNLCEESKFHRIDGKWFYISGTIV